MVASPFSHPSLVISSINVSEVLKKAQAHAYPDKPDHAALVARSPSAIELGPLHAAAAANTLLHEIAGMAHILHTYRMGLVMEDIRMRDLEAHEARHYYRIFYPSGLQFQLEGRLETVKMEGDLYPVVLLASDEIMILDPRAVIANVGSRGIEYSPRYHPLESFSRAFQSWLAEWPSWGMPGCLPVERVEEGG